MKVSEPVAVSSDEQTQRVHRPGASSYFVLYSLALAAFLFYTGWNVYFFVLQRQIPPSILTYYTGLPCPTTGCTRALKALLRGELITSLRYNCMLVPICAVFAWSFFELAAALVRKRKRRLSRALTWAWLIILALAWGIKLIQFVLQ